VERTGLVDALVALQSHESGIGSLRNGPRQLGLAHACRTFHQQRLAQPVSEEYRCGRCSVGQVAGLCQPPRNIFDVCEQRRRACGDAHWVSPNIFLVQAGRVWPSPHTIHLVDVNSGRPIGPRACSFWVEMPISAPNPNCSPSVNAVDALTITAAASTRSLNRWAAARFVVTMASVCPVPYSLMCAIAASSPSTTASAMSIDRNSARSSSSEGSACTVTPASCNALVSRGTACPAIDLSISTDSAALQTLGLRVLAFNRMCSA